MIKKYETKTKVFLELARKEYAEYVAHIDELYALHGKDCLPIEEEANEKHCRSQLELIDRLIDLEKGDYRHYETIVTVNSTDDKTGEKVNSTVASAVIPFV